jgi:hypothetical protein
MSAFGVLVAQSPLLVSAIRAEGVSVRQVPTEQTGQGYLQLGDHLEGPESQCAPRALHDDCWAQAAQDACLIVFGGIEDCNNSIVGPAEQGPACRASYCVSVSDGLEALSVGAVDAEYMAV